MRVATSAMSIPPVLVSVMRRRSHPGVTVSMTSEVGVARCGRRYARGVTELVSSSRVGSLLRDWRRRRRLSQLDLALEAGVSARHVSFVETGRSRPSAEMVLLLAEQLDVPLRARHQRLLRAG